MTETIIRPHTRRISLENDFFNYKIDDLIYGILACLATYHPELKQLYISKAEIRNNTRLIYPICAGTATPPAKMLQRKIKTLIDNGLLKEGNIKQSNGTDLECYFFTYDDVGAYYIIKKDLLRYIVDTKSVHGIQLYIYLADRMKYITSTDRDDLRSFTIKELSMKLGYSASSHAHLQTITNTLEDLKRTGLIDYVNYSEMMPTKNGQLQPVQRYRLTKVTTELSDLPKV